MKAYLGRHTPKDGTSIAPAGLVHTAWENLFTNPPPYVALDVETPTLKNRRVMGVGIATPQDDNFYFDFTDPAMPWHLFMPSITRKIWHNACLPLSYQILTRTGWKCHNEVKIGDETLAYDNTVNVTRWCKITGIANPKYMPLVTFSNKRLSFTSSTDHRWVDADGDFINAAEITSQHHARIQLSAQCETEGTSQITPREASIIGWLLTDGSVTWHKLTGKTSQVSGSKQHVHAYISQAKPEQLAELKLLLAGAVRTTTVNNNVTKYPVYKFYLRPQFVRDLWDKTDLPRVNKPQLSASDIETFVISLSTYSRNLFFNAVMQGDGYKNRNVIAQQDGAIKEGLKLATYMAGYVPKSTERSIIMLYPYMTGQHLEVTKGFGEAWCVQTELGTWTARGSDGVIFLTGNTFDLSREALGKFGADKDNIEDTAVIARMLNMDVQLSTAALNTNARTQSVAELFTKYKVKSMEDLPWREVAHKCINDARVTMQFYEKYKDDVNKENYEVERKMTSMLLYMSHRGIALDQPLLVDIVDEMQERVEFFNIALDFNYRSVPQTRLALFKAGLIPRTKYSKATGLRSFDTGKDALEELDHTLPKAIVEARRYSKLHSTLKDLVGLDRAYSHFHLDSATRRITSEDIQMHNLPSAKRPGDIHPKAGPVKRILMPDSGEWTRFDLSQIELRVLEWLCKDPTMTMALNMPVDDPRGGIHGITMTALELFSRVIAKNFNFGSIFGGGIFILMQFTGIKDKAVLGAYQRKYFDTYPVMKTWLDNQREQGLRDGFVTTIHGQKLSLEIPMMSGERHAGNCAVNYPIQGSAAEIFKRLLIAILDVVPMEDFVLQVHDEELLEGYHELPEEELAHLEPFWTPLEVSHISRWQ